MSQPLVSIIIPTFNRVHLLEETLDSILAQSYSKWECLVVDDGSTDDTEKVAQLYCKQDARFQYYKRPEYKTKGANACRNYGLNNCKGKFVVFFDSDDLMLPNKLEIQLKDIVESDYDFVVSQTELFNVKTQRSLGLRAPQLTSDNLIDDFINFKTFWLTGAPLWRLEFLNNNNLIFDEKLQQAQDFDFHLRVLQKLPHYKVNNAITSINKIHYSNMSILQSDSIEKLMSNAYVQHLILNDFKDEISDQTQKDSFIKLVNIYRDVLRIKHFNESFEMIKLIFSHISVVNLSNPFKIKLVYRCIIALIYPLTGKGFRLTKLSAFEK